MTNQALIDLGKKWFQQRGWTPFPFQLNAWSAYLEGKSGLINAPTGSGKTYSLFIPIALEFIRQHPNDLTKSNNGIQAIWITPIRALTKEIKKSAERAIEGLGLKWTVAVRSGDTKTSERNKIKKKPPEILITTPESLHILIASKGYEKYFKNLKTVVVDEWHELLGSKRGVQMELGLSRLRGFLPELKTWGISATIGNLAQGMDVLMGATDTQNPPIIIKANIQKKMDIIPVLPDEIERFPWSGHLGITLLSKVVPILQKSKTSLIFTNTRAQCEIWYQQLLEVAPDFAGQMAMHHGSISRELRDWVETALHEEQLKVVVCTSSLDLGVDFRPVETIVQIGSPKGVARFVQRAGRSGHQPGATSRIYFVPTHSLELIESAALRDTIKKGEMESRVPYVRSFDVLTQYLVTLAVSDGFVPAKILAEVRRTFSFRSISDQEWAWALSFITSGGAALFAYDEYKKVSVENGLYQVDNKSIARRHRMSMGTIVGNAAQMEVRFMNGKKIGMVEEWFVSQLSKGDTFWFAGRSLEIVRIKNMTVQVRASKKKKGKIPAWLGGRLQLSSQLSASFREKVMQMAQGNYDSPELKKLKPLADLQQERSHLPTDQEFLVEYFKSREGYHLVFYPFEGRGVHEGMSALFAHRIGQLQPISFSIAMNDYGFELLSDTEIPIQTAIEKGLFSTKNLIADIQTSVNNVELAKRAFREIAGIAGLVFQGFPGMKKKDRHLQASSQLFFDVFHDYEPDNLLYLQAFDEVLNFQLDESRMRLALERINGQRLVLSQPKKATPFAFPIMVDRLRERMSTEKLIDRIQKMKLMLVK
ncbi:MAG: ligase-associated DNA damage response DEXH box helicase [Bacteroidota bacterium]